MQTLLRLILIATLALFFSIGLVSDRQTLAGAQVCRTTTTQVNDTCCETEQNTYCCAYEHYCVSYSQCNWVSDCSCTQNCAKVICGSGGCFCGYDCSCTPPRCERNCTGYGLRCSSYCTENVRSCYSCTRTQTSQTCNYLPDAPNLTSPANGQSSSNSNFTLTWSGNDPDNGPTSPMYYELSVQPPGQSFQVVCDFNSCPRGGSGTIVSRDYTANAQGTYNWRVRAWDGWTNNDGSAQYSEYSSTRSFSFSSIPPDAPSLIGPPNASIVTKPVVLTWRGNDPDSAPVTPMDYKLVVRSADNSYIGGFDFGTGHTGSNNQSVSYSFNAPYGGNFYWKVQAWDGGRDNSGQPVYSSYSVEQVFVVDADCN